MNEWYYIVTMTDGKVLDFNKRCRRFGYFESNITIVEFYDYVGENGFKNREILAVIPAANIYAIERVEVMKGEKK